MTITLDDIKAEHSKIAGMIAVLEAQAKLESSYPITISAPKLNSGERHVGIIISAVALMPLQQRRLGQ